MKKMSAGRLVRLVAFAASAALAAGCSTATDAGKSFVDAQGNHPAGWVSVHPSYALPDGTKCAPCHGGDLRGGISGVSCFSATVGGVSCHAEGPAFHPATWLDKAAAAFHGTAWRDNVLVNGLACAGCHDPSNPSVPPGYNCLECHFSENGTQRVPSGSPFVHGTIVGHEAFGTLDVPNAVSSVCMNCHDVNNRYGHMPQPFCHNCHAPAPASFHPAGWSGPALHGAAAKEPPGISQGLESCRTCHGVNFNGGNVGVSCFSCHGVNAPHPPSPWRIFGGSTLTHDNTSEGNASVCFYCHEAGRLSPLPPPPAPPPGTPPGCFNNTLCHGPMGHAVPFRGPDHTGVTQDSFPSTCAGCHAVSGNSPNPAAPACEVCHRAGSPLTSLNCTSCHAAPPSGASYPNFGGAHGAHLLLNATESPVVCATCHTGLDNGTLAHYNNANGRPGAGGLVQPGNVAFLSLYNARTGSAAFDNSAALSCSNVSCHGGQNTPNWQTGAINVNAQCGTCHQLGTSTAGGIPQYNVYFSGRHKKHVAEEAIACTTCHSTALLAGVHFDDLSSAAMTQARATINRTALNFADNVSPPTCNPNGPGGIGGCHGTQSWTQQSLP